MVESCAGMNGNHQLLAIFSGPIKVNAELHMLSHCSIHFSGTTGNSRALVPAPSGYPIEVNGVVVQLRDPTASTLLGLLRLHLGGDHTPTYWQSCGGCWNTPLIDYIGPHTPQMAVPHIHLMKDTAVVSIQL